MRQQQVAAQPARGGGVQAQHPGAGEHRVAADARQRSLEEARRDLPKNDVGPMSIQQQVQQQAQQQGQQPANTNTGLRPQGPIPVSTGVNAAGTFRLIDVSLDVISSVGTSTARNDVIQQLQGGHHDPKQRGFTMQQAELALAGAVDPYFRAEGHIAVLEDGIELEEAFAQTTSLPAGLELEAGLSLAEFGRNNPTHPHTWAWTDRPLPVARLLGGDGTRGVGTRIGWGAPLPWYSRMHAGVMDATNEVATSFGGAGEEEGEPTVGGRQFTAVNIHNLADLLWSVRWENAVEFGDAAPQLRPDLYARDILQQHWRAAVAERDRNGAEVVQRFEVTAGAHHVFGFAELDDRAAGFPVGVAHRPDHA